MCRCGLHYTNFSDLVEKESHCALSIHRCIERWGTSDTATPLKHSTACMLCYRTYFITIQTWMHGCSCNLLHPSTDCESNECLSPKCPASRRRNRRNSTGPQQCNHSTRQAEAFRRPLHFLSTKTLDHSDVASGRHGSPDPSHGRPETWKVHVSGLSQMSISWCAKKLHLGVSLQIPSEKNRFCRTFACFTHESTAPLGYTDKQEKGSPKRETSRMQADLTAEAQLRFEALFYGFLRPRSLGSMWCWYTTDSGLVRFRASGLTGSGAGLAYVFHGFRTPCPANDLARQCVRPGSREHARKSHKHVNLTSTGWNNHLGQSQAVTIASGWFLSSVGVKRPPPPPRPPL